MKVILLKDVSKLGKEGDLVEVAPGYARNYLIPNNFAKEATKGNIKQLKHERKIMEKKEQKELEEAKKLAEKLGNSQIELKAKSGEQGKLFGSVTTKDIAEAIKKQHNVTVDKRKIQLNDSIKSLGTYEVTVKFVPEVESKIRVKVVER